MDFNAVTLAEVPFDTAVDVPYVVKVAFDQSEMVCSVNGEVVLTHWDANPWPTGQAGVGTLCAHITCGEMHYMRREM
ncbi:MAG: hypothetical protein E7333_05445 [Clostridiales bacterium]|nr:hypothetical protein [Clostridiales bacterium]